MVISKTTVFLSSALTYNRNYIYHLRGHQDTNLILEIILLCFERFIKACSIYCAGYKIHAVYDMLTVI